MFICDDDVLRKTITFTQTTAVAIACSKDLGRRHVRPHYVPYDRICKSLAIDVVTISTPSR